MINPFSAVGFLMAVAAPAAASPYTWSERVVVIYAESAADAKLHEQRAKLVADRSALAERDMVVFAVLANGTVEPIYGAAPTAAGARRLPGQPADKTSFAVVLIGKDGGLKSSWPKPVEPDIVFGLIDAMPMRRQETRSQRAP